MIRASSLFYALMVSLLLGALLSAVIMNAHLRSMLAERWLAYNVARDDAYAALGVEVPRPPMLVAVADSLNLFAQGDHYVSISQAAWGVFDIRTCSGYESDQRVARSALLGWRCDPKAPSLWVVDRNEPIALAGDTRLNGPCFLPAKGLRRAYIEGRPYSGSLTLEDQRTSGSMEPVLPERIKEHIRLFAADVGSAIQSVPWSAIPHDSLRVGFSDPPVLVDLGTMRELSNAYVSGHVLFIARDTVVVEASFRCSGVVICAPYVTIASGFSGDLQCFTRQGTAVEPDAELLYPSVLVCTGDTGGQGATISIGEGSGVEGVIIGWVMRDDAKPVTVEFATGTTFEGELWNDGPVQLHGTMEGTVIAESVVLRTPSSVYRGHIMDVLLGPSRRAEQVGVGIWGEQTDVAVLRWLDVIS